MLADCDPQRLPSAIAEEAMRELSAGGACFYFAGPDRRLYPAASAGEATAPLVEIPSPRLLLERSRIVLPIASGERLLGVVVIERAAFETQDADRAALFGAQVRQVLEHRELLQRVAGAERLAGIGQLASGVSHEINNPVACVISAITALHAELGDLDSLAPGPEREARLSEMREILADCNQGALRIRDLARDLRSLSRGPDSSPALADVKEAVASALRVTGAHLKRCAQVKTELQPDLMVACSPGKLSQVLINLLLNAVQAMEGRSGAANEICVCARAEGERITISVSDNGPGVKPEHLPRMFEAFFTTRRGATGLGLSLAREIVEQRGGQMKVASVYGEGATFTLELDRAPDP
ncbi:MAG: ATP-binding protein [Myxococcaceae bacterium]